MDSVKQEKRLVEVIAEFVVSEKFETLPPETVEKAKEFALDVIEKCPIAPDYFFQLKTRDQLQCNDHRLRVLV